MYINQLRSRGELKLDLINTTFYRSIADSELKLQVLDPLSSLSSTLTWVGTQSPRRLRLSYNNHRADYVSCRSRVNRLGCFCAPLHFYQGLLSAAPSRVRRAEEPLKTLLLALLLIISGGLYILRLIIIVTLVLVGLAVQRRLPRESSN